MKRIHLILIGVLLVVLAAALVFLKSPGPRSPDPATALLAEPGGHGRTDITGGSSSHPGANNREPSGPSGAAKVSSFRNLPHISLQEMIQEKVWDYQVGKEWRDPDDSATAEKVHEIFARIEAQAEAENITPLEALRRNPKDYYFLGSHALPQELHDAFKDAPYAPPESAPKSRPAMRMPLQAGPFNGPPAEPIRTDH